MIILLYMKQARQIIVWPIPAVMQSAWPGPKICQESNYIYTLAYSVFEVHSPNVVSDDVRDIAQCIANVTYICFMHEKLVQKA